MIQPTSLEAYHVIEPDLGNLQREVYIVIKNNSHVSNHDISRILGWEINRVTPRVKELRAMGLVVCMCTKTDRLTKRKVMCWVIKNEL